MRVFPMTQVVEQLPGACAPTVADIASAVLARVASRTYGHLFPSLEEQLAERPDVMAREALPLIWRLSAARARSSTPSAMRNTAPDQCSSAVEVRGFEPLTPAVRRQCSTGLSYTPGTTSVAARSSSLLTIARRSA